MFLQSNLPWAKIHDFLVEVGSQHSVKEYKSFIMKNIDNLIPYDVSATWLEMSPTGPTSICDAIGISREWVLAHNEYYYRVTPAVCDPAILKAGSVDWDLLQDTEYACDFVLPQRVRYGTGFILHDSRGNPSLTFTLTDSKHNYGQSEQIQCILEVIRPHLANYYSYLNLVSTQNIHEFHPVELAADCKPLSKREAEVAALLCRRLTIPEIASKLLISPHTVRTYVENIKEKLNVNNRRELILKLSDRGK